MLTGMPHSDTARLATAADLLELERHEVVDGEIVKKASPTAWHSYAQGRLLVAIDGLLGTRQAGWWILPECTIELAPHEVYQPDVAGWRVERMPELPEAFPMKVEPDWVCEVLSPSTARRDVGHKLRAYHSAQVRHYWIVDTHNRTLAILRWQETAYALIVTAGAGDVVHPEPFDGQLAVAELFVGMER
jgi:Uma2 family endonuclease